LRSSILVDGVDAAGMLPAFGGVEVDIGLHQGIGVGVSGRRREVLHQPVGLHLSE
jgi:hypothetical protein